MKCTSHNSQIFIIAVIVLGIILLLILSAFLLRGDNELSSLSRDFRDTEIIQIEVQVNQVTKPIMISHRSEIDQILNWIEDAKKTPAISNRIQTPCRLILHSRDGRVFEIMINEVQRVGNGYTDFYFNINGSFYMAGRMPVIERYIDMAELEEPTPYSNSH